MPFPDGSYPLDVQMLTFLLSNSHLTLILNSNVGGINLSFQLMAITLYLAIAHLFITAEEVVGVLEWRRSVIDPAVG